MNPDGPNKFSPDHHQPFPNQPINPDPEGVTGAVADVTEFFEKVDQGTFGKTAARISQAEIDRRLDLHTPSDPVVKEKLDMIRAQYKELYQDVVHLTNEAPREQAIALHHLEDALQATIAALVRPVITQPSSWSVKPAVS